MGDINLKFIFANYDGKALERPFAASTLVRDIKRTLLAEHWPPDISITVEQVDRLRFFCGGKELEDAKSLQDQKVAAADFPTAVHVNTVLKRPGGGHLAGKHSCLQCSIM
ncbi:unnamed protein product [Vitrella brassicaformis CCMP3155]|uniref:UBL3-like ubiquitin domain-containing protein n=2 Tax=Vitrella brassicaformis TaxID=1169539 RepID=A0A0G4EJB9_VITBC|nr:unnamed protein product [Vitrella brassicaformis CCMP3155]|mmetsp:Transcript_31968/g.79278  ORF Transcript_31968/g.79278 Transcript_31968/m.79278 type:complete len:110 (+) Transcript_31968:184-513(+)|eukprot:CEL96592.1 unnamed protein product [Vitrella brassicaformis CCMP3155]